jgi:dynein heavy chain, axonemal
VVVSISESKRLLKEAQDNILTLLSESKGNILDNVELIKTLEESKKSSAIIKKKLEETTIIEEEINASRSSYIPVSIRGTVLYFVISDLALIDPMYQFSLTYFKKLFSNAIETAGVDHDQGIRIENILDSITKLMFTDICRGLF